ncbi:MAG: hypothetical protein AUJ92_17390 [Armatimonadetes bacterium CG2_30_59_28]|nr:hypothetical protein [Armatimonadota bacterium]OIO91038.1 MAG: hypothetical protein AUJ92_17390 [Armatimonadetes bacterium CG2_30_59_28]PIU63159.1 MAG: hypothetical protein COS85_16520 [Armatimonadetes bacterium CG07_land_8_20_14_0_80_59_28]PIX42304.1 MAG: hypothetical protein COZ56_09675 [Armatimonadetes bacterium CG_4_8_14_3_um_filter_58_9]
MRRGKAIIVNLLFAATLSATAAPATEALPFLVAERTTQTPGIDGQLTDACWERAEQTNPFVNIGGSKAPVETYGKLCWDDKNLYVGIVCGEPEMEKVKERLRRSLFNTMEESIEIFIDSDHDQFTYLQFRVGIRGERDTHRGNDLDPRLTSQWLGAAGIEDDRWTVEAAIPLRVLRAETRMTQRPSNHTIWGMNLNRQRCLQTAGMWTCWSDTKGGFHSPHRFGKLIFTDYEEWQSAYSRHCVQTCLEKIRQLSTQYQAHRQFADDRVATLKATLRDSQTSLRQEKLDTQEKRDAALARGESVAAVCEEALADLRLHIIANEFR